MAQLGNSKIFGNLEITGISIAPTAAVNTNTAQLATTAFVLGQAGTAVPKIIGTTTTGTSLKFAREDHTHSTNATSTNTASTIVTRDASGNFSAGIITAKLSGDADTVDGFHASTASGANTLVAQDASGDINCRLIRPNYTNQTTISGAIAFRTNNSTDNYIRFCSDATAIRTFIDAAASSHGTHVTYGTTVSSLSFGGASGPGSASTVARSDHMHQMPAAPVAATVSVHDSGSLYTATDVEAALAEVMTKANSAFQSASDGKTAIATAITGKGVPSTSADTFTTMATKITSINISAKWLYTSIDLTQYKSALIDNSTYLCNVSAENRTGDVIVWKGPYDTSYSYQGSISGATISVDSGKVWIRNSFSSVLTLIIYYIK